MLNSQPIQCTNPACCASSIRVVHRSRQWFTATAVDGRQGQAHLLVYRCFKCGHMWATRATTVEFIMDLTPQSQEPLRAFA